MIGASFTAGKAWAIQARMAAHSGSLGAAASHEAAEKWNGQVRQDGNLGRTELLLAATLSHRPGITELGLSVRVPVWRHIVTGDEPPGTLSSPLIVSLSATHVFEGK